jgi:hypothetical protein
MERRLYLAGTAEPYRPKWPSIAAASTELRRPRHLHAVPSIPAAEPERAGGRRGSASVLDARRP